MADRDIVQNLIFQLGQSQSERLPRELDVHYADVDERTPEELLRFAHRFAKLVNFYEAKTDAAAGDWTALFPEIGPSLDSYLGEKKGAVPPHLALYLAFLELYQRPREIANGITGRHLDFYYHDVLRLTKRPAAPDHAHLLLELKKGAPSVVIRPEHVFSAGKDAAGVELLYAPVGETVVNAARVDSLRSIFLDRAGHGAIRFAPVANSVDGLGGAFASGEPKWFGFGSAGLPEAEVGFAIASPVLRMREGERTVTVRLTLSGVDSTKVSTSSLSDAFSVFLTGAKRWIEPTSVSTTLGADQVLKLELTVAASADAVVDYDEAIHGYRYAATAPLIQILLRRSDRVGYLDFRDVVVESASVSVDVSKVTSLALESDVGTLDPKKSFLPFGPQPTERSRFMVGYPEALSKKLSEVRVSVRWKDAPSSFATHYDGYGVTGVNNSYFTASVSFRDGGGTEFNQSMVGLFEPMNASAEHELTFLPGTTSSSRRAGFGEQIHALNVAGSRWAMREAYRTVLSRPIMAAFLRPAPPPAREGFVTITLDQSFLHAEYRKKYVDNVVTFGRNGGVLTILNEPYTPSVQSISLAYRASSGEVAISSDSLVDFASPDVQFFHVAPFGPSREHGYQQAQLPFLSGTDVTLLPSFKHGGELLIGVSNLAPRDSVSLLFQVAAGSADPDLEQENIDWFVLSDNHWRPLGADDVVLDTTNKLLASGIVKIVVPAEATAANTVLPAGRIWIKAAIAGNVTAVNQLLDVAANAVEVRFVDQGNDPAHLESALKAGTIAKLKTGVAAVKSVAQAYGSFGGRSVERDRAFYTRVSERLRHKNRCVTAWDYERIVLEAFPSVQRVKCIPHAKDGSWMAPGHVLLVVVPDLRNRNAIDPLQPRVDADTISRITAHVQTCAGPQVQVKVKNPRYQKIKLAFKVRFHRGYEFNHYRDALQTELIHVLSPWAFDAVRDISFGGTVYKSVLLDFVEELPYVDFVTDFRMFSFTGGAVDSADLPDVRPSTPDAILVSDQSHAITAVD